MATRSDEQPKNHNYYVVLVLQGGGALGAYHIGAYRALKEAGYTPDWVAGVSIGSINAAVIAGNKPEEQLSKLEQLWNEISGPFPWDLFLPASFLRLYHNSNALWSLLFGQPNFSRPHFVNPYLAPVGTPQATGVYSNDPLRNTLKRLVDLDRINAQQPRLSLSVTKVRTGNVVFFDNTRADNGPITLDHILASTSIPPLYSGTWIDGELYWDGGVVDNTPLDPVLEDQDLHPKRETLVFMIDLWDASGPEPRTLDEVLWRQNQIEFASRTDRHLKAVVEKENLRRTISRMAQHLPTELTSGLPALEDGTNFSYGNLDIVRITYQPRPDQVSLSYVDFSYSSVEGRIADGYTDMKAAIEDAPWFKNVEADGSVTRVAPHTVTTPEKARAALHHIKQQQVQSEFPGHPGMRGKGGRAAS